MIKGVFISIICVSYLCNNDGGLESLELVDIEVVETVALGESLGDLAIDISGGRELGLGLGQDWQMLDRRGEIIYSIGK